ncbi:Glutathione-dependent formaldehyde-activating enzyme/centromere protein V [Penicillium brevicompactum]|uniref:Glutathione-dependent formaldehyde-activating enzyme/centromere protein V n=1 Tax=Penicillium brevicompactum TaxID=5074 RepID=A0A9W9RK08_PENBR|nr:Glutathione-dependent formaldehyde-activating enzyme/centromere protein V [Penicillium brevicompactum]KAJ5332691.1 Glutathione-dependent formaldehyde-activating enzyme/centromere protein V [Penicillium brevicompactum]KAJ5361655.1 Glutathione-dependent formaldehyde-activating enzyme/centromere protein V [Penicillium brevicompactum]
MTVEPLRGSCSCGRNEYQINIPEDVTDHAEVYFDSSRDNRRFHGTPLSAWLRVPLDWYQSTTRSFYEDETHSSIRRSFSPRHAPNTKRVFCGFCGTPLTFWTEDPHDESDFMSVAIGSLLVEDQRVLDDLGLLPEDFDEDAPHAGVSTSSDLAPAQTDSSVIVPSFETSSEFPDISRSLQRGRTGGIPWFEEMMEGSRLGRLMRSRRGMGISDDQSTSIQWEFSEWHDDGTGGVVQQDSDSGGRPRGKRKRVAQADTENKSPSKRAE